MGENAGLLQIKYTFTTETQAKCSEFLLLAMDM